MHAVLLKMIMPDSAVTIFAKISTFQLQPSSVLNKVCILVYLSSLFKLLPLDQNWPRSSGGGGRFDFPYML
jgi:hypothetical protein